MVKLRQLLRARSLGQVRVGTVDDFQVRLMLRPGTYTWLQYPDHAAAHMHMPLQ